MPVFFQQQINHDTRLAVWKIEETEEYFKGNVPQHRDVTHPHKRLQHLAGRFLLQYLFPDFPFHLIEIADTRRPYLPQEEYHFSISHCGDYVAALVSRTQRVGIDVEEPQPKIESIGNKFTSLEELKLISKLSEPMADINLLTSVWCIKESIFKWYGEGKVDFRKDIRIRSLTLNKATCFFSKTGMELQVDIRKLGEVWLAGLW